MIEDVIKALEAKPPGMTKKEACEALGLLTPAGNPQYAKLTKTLEEHKIRAAAEKKVRAKKRREAFSDSELKQVITDYLAGASMSELSESYYRSVGSIKSRLDYCGALLRGSGDYDNPEPLPEQCVVDSHKEGDMVWSAKYGQLARVVKEYTPGVYRIFMSSPSCRQYAYQESFELGALKHLETLGVKFNLVTNDY